MCMIYITVMLRCSFIARTQEDEEDEEFHEMVPGFSNGSYRCGVCLEQHSLEEGSE